MKVFVAGASGAIGRPLVPQLLAAGHEVTGMTRREERADTIRAAGADAVVCDALDADALRDAVVEAQPEVVVHELTALPARIDFKGDPFGSTTRLRIEGTRNLVAAAKAAGARRLIAESFASLYAPEGSWVKDEDAPLFPMVLEGIRLLEDDALGGGGSRGSGRVSFSNLRLVWRGRKFYAAVGTEKVVGAGATVAAIQAAVTESAFSFLHEE